MRFLVDVKVLRPLYDMLGEETRAKLASEWYEVAYQMGEEPQGIAVTWTVYDEWYVPDSQLWLEIHFPATDIEAVASVHRAFDLALQKQQVQGLLRTDHHYGVIPLPTAFRSYHQVRRPLVRQKITADIGRTFFIESPYSVGDETMSDYQIVRIHDDGSRGGSIRFSLDEDLQPPDGTRKFISLHGVSEKGWNMLLRGLQDVFERYNKEVAPTNPQ